MKNEDKRYYWIKLKTNFFNIDEIDFLLSQENGCKYVVLYQMLCLSTANNGGNLCTQIGEMIVPYDIDKIVRDTKYFDVDTVIVALELFKKLGLIYEEENKVFKISKFEEMVGSESAWAEKKRLYREKQKQLGQSEDNVREEYRDKSIENRDKNIDKKKDIKKEYFSNKSLNDLFLDFLDVRKKLRAVNSERAINNLIKKLSKYDDATKYQMIENSITNSWKDVYPLKQPIRKEVVPEWFDKKVEKEQLPDDELEELQKELASFNDDWKEEAKALKQELEEKY